MLALKNDLVAHAASSRNESVDALKRLRAATQALHHQLDAQLPLARIDARRSDYLAHLCVLQPWLAALAPFMQRIGWGDGYARLAADDLALAGEPVPAAWTPAWPASSAAPGFVWGVAYVVEGSQLGGQTLYRRLQGALAPLPLNFLRGHGDATGSHWRRFLAALDEALDSHTAIDAACDGAVWAFTTLIDNYKRKGLVG